jgi:hypothetical protein
LLNELGNIRHLYKDIIKNIKFQILWSDARSRRKKILSK